MMLSVVLGGVELNAAEGTGGAGCWIKPPPDGISGWDDAPDRRANFTDRAMQHGVYDAPTFTSARVVTLGGYVSGDQATMVAWRKQLASLGAMNGDLLTLAIQDDLYGSTQAKVRLTSGLSWKWWPSRDGAEWQLIVTAPDPIRYSISLNNASTGRYVAGTGRSYPLTHNRTYGALGTTGFATAVNAGTVPSFPVITFTGPLVNPAVTLVGGGTFALNMTLGAGDQVIADMQARSVTLQGQSRRSMVVQGSSWWALQPGVNTIYVGADSGAGTAAVQWRDAWV